MNTGYHVYQNRNQRIRERKKNQNTLSMFLSVLIVLTIGLQEYQRHHQQRQMVQFNLPASVKTVKGNAAKSVNSKVTQTNMKSRVDNFSKKYISKLNRFFKKNKQSAEPQS